MKTQQQHAEALIGAYVLFRYLPKDVHPTPRKVIEAVNGMVRLAGFTGYFAPHLLVEVPSPLGRKRKGDPIHKFLHEFLPNLPFNIELLIAYTPDAVWVAEQTAGDRGNKDKLIRAIAASQTRKPVIVRDRTAEEMKRVI